MPYATTAGNRVYGPISSQGIVPQVQGQPLVENGVTYAPNLSPEQRAAADRSRANFNAGISHLADPRPSTHPFPQGAPVIGGQAPAPQTPTIPLLPNGRRAPEPYTPPPGSGGGGGGGGAGALGPIAGASDFSYDPFSFNFQAPEFAQVEDFSYDPFAAPTLEAAQNAPGYQFRMQEGNRALENSAAARGLLRSGGTLKDILQYGQSFGESAYQNVYDRRFNEYQTNRANAADIWSKGYQSNLDEYQIDYGREMDRFNRSLQEWQGNLGLATQRYGYDLDVTQMQRAEANAAAGRAASAANAQARLAQQQQQNTIGNLMGIYQASQPGFSAPPPAASYGQGYGSGLFDRVNNPGYGGGNPVGTTAPQRGPTVGTAARRPTAQIAGGAQSIYSDPYAGYEG